MIVQLQQKEALALYDASNLGSDQPCSKIA